MRDSKPYWMTLMARFISAGILVAHLFRRDVSDLIYLTTVSRRVTWSPGSILAYGVAFKRATQSFSSLNRAYSVVSDSISVTR